MREDKRRRLKAGGWKIGDAKEFLGLTDEEAAYIESIDTRPVRKTLKSTGRLSTKALRPLVQPTSLTVTDLDKDGRASL